MREASASERARESGERRAKREMVDIKRKEKQPEARIMSSTASPPLYRPKRI